LITARGNEFKKRGKGINGEQGRELKRIPERNGSIERHTPTEG